MDFKDFSALSIICEDIYLDQDKITFGYGKKVEGGVSTKLGKDKIFTPYQSKITELEKTIYSVYSIDNNKQILTAIKSKQIDNNEYQKFLKRTAIYIAAKILKNYKPDIIITPMSSSNILNDFINHLQNIIPHVIFMSDTFKKVNDPEKISIDYSNPKITPKIIKSLEYIIGKAKKDGYFQIKKIDKRFTKFVSNYFELVDRYKYEKIKGKNIVLLDDLYSSGATFSEMIKIILQYDPKNLIGISLFKTK